MSVTRHIEVTHGADQTILELVTDNCNKTHRNEHTGQAGTYRHIQSRLEHTDTYRAVRHIQTDHKYTRTY